MQNIVIAIDGPSGVGKSTVAKQIARRLSYLYIDSGAVYRAIGLKALQTGVDLSETESLAGVAKGVEVRLEGDPDHLRVFLDGTDVTTEIRSPEASHAASVVATKPGVRAAVVNTLREMSRGGGVVMDGRDIGTAVFPDAQVKVFFEAVPEERARRRWQEDLNRGRTVSLEEVQSEIDVRDRRDRERDATPLVKADDAILIDTSDLSIEQVTDRVLEIVESRR